MGCLYGNASDQQCLEGLSTDSFGLPCDDPGCGSVAVSGGAAASTVVPNPAIPSGGSGIDPLTQMTSTMSQFGTTLASIISGTPVTQSGSTVKVGTAAVSPTQSLFGGQNSGMLLLLLAVVVVVIVIADKK